ADAAGGPGDQGDLPVQPVHGHPFVSIGGGGGGGGGAAGRASRPRSQASGFTIVGGRAPSSVAIRLSAASRPIATRVSTVALPWCGARTAFSSWSSFGSTCGSRANTS